MTPEPVSAGAGTAFRVGRPQGADRAGRAASGDREAIVIRSEQRQWLCRRDLERRLHDGAALRISALALRLGLLRHRMPKNEHEFSAAVEGIQDELHLALQELRDVAGWLYPPLLDEAGLGAALREVADRSAVPVRIDATGERFGPAAEGAAYFAVLGCLTAAPVDGERSGRPIEVAIRRDGDTLALLVSGVAACHAPGIDDGVRLLGGSVVVDENAITVRIPCA
jgi:signal transduction histidine kinase